MTVPARDVLLGAVRLDRSRLAWKAPLRSSIVLLILVAIPVANGNPATAIPVAIGALFVGIADMGEHVGMRWRTMLWTTLWLMIGTALGVAFSESAIGLILVSAGFAALCGYVGVLGPRGALAGLLSLVVLTVFGGSPQPEWNVVPTALLVGLGGVVQAAVTVLPTMIRHPGSARRPTPAELWLPRLRTHLDWSDDFLRHGVRLAIAIGAATWLAFLLNHPHSYWIPMTVAWVAKPDTRGTATRVLARIVGTLLGLGLVALLVDGLNAGQWGIVAVAGIGSMLAMAFIWADYAIAVSGVTVLVIALFALIGEPIIATAPLRIVDTLIAGIIVLAATFAWPAKRHP